jgi:hypothetical protein
MKEGKGRSMQICFGGMVNLGLDNFVWTAERDECAMQYMYGYEAE